MSTPEPGSCGTVAFCASGLRCHTVRLASYWQQARHSELVQMKEHAHRWSLGWRAARSAGGVIVSLVALGGACPAASAAASVASGPAVANQVERGRYLVKTTGCNDCHTPGYIESAGRLEESRWLVGNSLGWQGPWGTTYPANLRLLTQDLTADQWLLVA